MWAWFPMENQSVGSGPVCQLTPHWFSESGAVLHSLCHAEWFPIFPPLFFVRTAIDPTKLATCWSLTWPWENNLQIQQSTQSIIIISKQPVAPKTDALRLSSSNQAFGFSQMRLSQRVWKTSYLVKHWISCSCLCNSSCNLSICPFKLVEVPLRWCWISLQEHWLEFHFTGVTHNLENPRSEESNREEVGPFQGSLFHDMASTSSLAAPKKGPSGEEHKHTLFPKLIVQLGLPIRPRDVGLQACFAQSVCLWVTLNYHHNSKNCTYILPAWLNSSGMFPDFPFFVYLIMF